MQTIPFTQTAYDEMRAKVAVLKTEEAAVLTRLQEAREQGDLSENSAYKYAKMELGATRRQLRHLGRLLEHAEVVSAPKNPQRVSFGCTVILENEATKDRTTYQLVSKHESNPLEGKMSVESPVGAAIQAKKMGDVVMVETPRGVVRYMIVGLR